MENKILTKRYTIILTIIIALSDNLFGLLNVDSINIKGVFSIDIIWQLLALGFSIYLCLKNPRENRVSLDEMNVCILVLVASCVIAALQCSLSTGQPFARGILPQRPYIVALLCALLLQNSIASKLIDVNKIFDIFMIAGTIVGFAYLFQAVSGVEIFHVLQNERYGSARLYAQSCFPDIAGFIGIRRLVKTSKIKYILPALAPVILSLFVSKGRLELVALLVTYFIIILIVQKKADIKFYIILIISFLLIVFASSPYGSRLISNFNLNNAESDTTSIRLEGRALYSSQLHESIINRIFGCGYPNVLFGPAAHRAGLDRGIILGDNGIFAFNYVYGILGMSAIICIALLILKFSIKNISTEVGSFCFSFFCFSVVACSNITWWWFSGAWPMVFSLVICCTHSVVYTSKMK